MLKFGPTWRKLSSLPLLIIVASLSLLFSGVAWLQSPANNPNPYIDVLSTNSHAEDIARLKSMGVLDGAECGDYEFCPDNPIDRKTFAVWMVRVMDGDMAPEFVGPNNPGEGESRFVDVNANEAEALFIDRLAEMGITNGCSQKPLRYCPDLNVSRDQMASFLSRAFELPTAEAANFTDVIVGSTHYDNINRLAGSGIANGCSQKPLRYCPNNPTTRAQMASFLVRAIDLQSSSQEGPYDDVSHDDYDDNISRLKDLGVFDGTECGDDKFCPDNPIDRKTFAIWLIRALDGDNAPDFVDPSSYPFDFSSLDSETQAALAQFFNLTPEQVETLMSQFSDVPYSHPEHDFIDRLAELGITSGCASEPLRPCPLSSTPRNQLATFMDRVFDFPDVKMLGFVDVDENSPHEESIKKSWAARVINECNFDQTVGPVSYPRALFWARSGPMLFCPEQAVSRAEAAKIISQALNWKKAYDQIKPTGTETAISLSATYSETDYAATLTWDVPVSKRGQVDKFILQWREPWRAFDAHPHSHKIIGANPDKSEYSTRIVAETLNDLYAARLIVVYKNNNLLATNEIKVPANQHQIRDLMEQEIIIPNQDSQPWLKDVWRHINDPEFGIDASKSASARVSSSSAAEWGGDKLESNTASVMTISSSAIDNFDSYKETIVHEFGHIYTLTNNISQKPATKSVAFIYLEQLYAKHSDNAKNKSGCWASELYADLAVLAFYDPGVSSFDAHRGTKPDSGFSLGYWAICGFNLTTEEAAEVYSAISDITKSVFLEQDMPNWFYDTYKNPDDSINLDKLWYDIHENKIRVLISHDLRNEFGGYCSETNVRRLLDKEISELKNHWKDAGCDKPEPALIGYLKTPQR